WSDTVRESSEGALPNTECKMPEAEVFTLFSLCSNQSAKVVSPCWAISPRLARWFAGNSRNHGSEVLSWCKTAVFSSPNWARIAAFASVETGLGTLADQLFFI